MFTTYVLKSPAGKYYIGHTNNLKRRIKEHNDPTLGRYTSTYGPWEIIYHKEFEKQITAMRHEKELKKQKGGNGFKNIIKNT